MSVLPTPTSTHQLRDAAHAWPDAAATQWIFDVVGAGYQDGRLVVAVGGADPPQIREAVAGFTLTISTQP